MPNGTPRHLANARANGTAHHARRQHCRCPVGSSASRFAAQAICPTWDRMHRLLGLLIAEKRFVLRVQGLTVPGYIASRQEQCTMR